jgi:hypothetical protein
MCCGPHGRLTNRCLETPRGYNLDRLLECRPILFFDGCHIKIKFGGIILATVGIDPNDSIYPIAFVVVEVESKASWKWFL